MIRSRQLVLLVGLAAMLCLTAFAWAAPESSPRAFAPVQNGFTTQSSTSLPYAPARLLIQFTPQAMTSINVGTEKGARPIDGALGLPNIDDIAAQAGVSSIERPYHHGTDAAKAAAFGKDRWFMFHFDNPGDLLRLAEAFRADKNVDAVSLDWLAYPATSPNDPLYTDQWGHNNTGQMLSYDWATYTHTGPAVGTPGFDSHAEEAWAKSQGYGSGVVIAILDSGADTSHPDLNLLPGYDFGDNDSNPDDDSASPGHGTACSGVAAAVANNNLGVSGIAGAADIMPLKVADSGGSMYFSYIQDALYYAGDHGVDVVSMSFGAAISSDAATDAALLYAYNKGVTLFAATGNENASTISYPAINPYVIGVGAASPCGDRKRSSSKASELNPGVSSDPNGYTCDGERWWGSNYGTTTQDAAGAVDIIAPTILPTTDISGSGGYEPGDYDMWFNGTSCATPYAAGCAALVKAANPGFTPAQVRDALTSTATDIVNVESGSGWDRYSGYGMVNVDAAIGGGGPVAPVADFTGTPTSGDYPLNVAFTDVSSGAPTSWSWTFGDGGTSTVQNPSHTYGAAGNYTVSLSVSNVAGSDAVTKTNYITVTAPPAPTAAFSGTPTSGAYPLNVTFTDQSTGSPTSWSWTFGDGGTSTAQNPSTTYNAAGTYDVSLTVSNANGSDSLTKTGYITVTEPGVATFVTASGETTVYGTVSGSYLNTVASDGVNEIITEEQYIGHPSRKTYSRLEQEWNFDLPSGGTVTFHLEAARDDNVEGDNMVFEYSTDGSTWLNLATVTSATAQTFAVGVGTLSGAVTVRAYDTDRTWGNIVLDALYVDYMAFEVADVQPVGPTADFVGTPTSGDYPLNVAFTDQSTGSPTSWSWTFGDGGTSTAQNPSYTYNAAGTYTVAMTATNAIGSDTMTKTGYITVTEPGSSPTMHVSAMAVSRKIAGPNNNGLCDVTVVDNSNAAVANATVTVSYDGPNSGTLSGVTATNGVAHFDTPKLKNPSGEWCFEVTNITHATLTYDASANLATRTCESGVVFGADQGRAPAELALGQNSPNPFNPMTVISFSLPREMPVTLRVFNVRGQEVKTLVAGSLGAGQHTVTWQAADSPSGVYFYRLEAPGFVQTRKMIMLK